MHEGGTDRCLPVNCRLPERREGKPPPPDLVERRAGFAAKPLPFAMRTDIDRLDLTLDGVDCIIFRPPAYKNTILYFHGGAYYGGSPISSAAYMSELAFTTGAKIVGVRYGLAPESPFPNALHDGFAAFRALCAQGETDILFAGDSAGGGLALALALACRDEGGPQPVRLILLSPWVDLSLAGASYQSRAATDQLFSHPMALDAADLYLQGIDARHPLASPLHADLRGLPPVQLFVGGDEILLDEDLALATALAQAGVTVELHASAGTQHVWPVLFPELEQSKRAMQAIARFTRG